MAVVLKKFPWAKDGFTVEMLSPGTEADFGAASDGLAAEGYISLETAVSSSDEPAISSDDQVVVPDEPTVVPAADQPAASDPEPAVVVEPAPVVEPAVEPEQPAPRTRKSR